MPTFEEKLNQRIAATGSRLCVGLDPRPDLLDGDVDDVLRRLIAETAPYAAALKPNMAYFEAMGVRGIELLEELLEVVPEDLPVILDAKRGDIGETQRYYAKAYFENWNVDAVTLSPFMGFDSIEPFLHHEGKGVYLLGVTSNPGSADIQRQKLADGRYVFELVQDFRLRAESEGLPGSVGLVIGLTNVEPEVMERVADVPLLVPGLGAQGGDLNTLCFSKRHAPVLINVSRGLMFPEGGKTFADQAQYYAELIANEVAR